MLHRRLKAQLLWGLLLAFLATVVTPAFGQSEADKATARRLAKEAQKALEAKDYAQAADKFGRAEELYHAPTLVLGLARAYVGQKKYVEAMESYNAVIREKLDAGASDAFRQAQADAQKEVEGLDAKIAWVTLKVDGPDKPTVTLDGAAVNTASLGVRRAVNPGKHELAAKAAGFVDNKVSFTVSAGDEKEVALALKPAPKATPTPVDPGADEAEASSSGIWPIVGWTAVGVGAAGLIVGGITGGLAWKKHNDIVSECDEQARCPPDQADAIVSFQELGNVSTATFIVGGVFAAAGVLILVLAPSDDAGGDVAFGPEGLTVRF